MKPTKIDWNRIRNDRELAGEWRILRAKIRHVVDRACALAENATRSIDDTDAIRTLRMFALDFIDGRPPRLPPSWLVSAVARLCDLDLADVYARAA